MGISNDDVLHVASLARITLADDEVERMAAQLSTVLGHVEALRELDLAGVEPTAHALDLANVTRPDRSRRPWPREELLAGAPAPEQGAFRVPPTS